MENIKYILQMILTPIFSVWDLIKVPVTMVWSRVAKILVWYKKLWVRCTHNKYDEFVYRRGAMMAAATVLSVIIIPTLVLLPLQTAYYWATYKKERVYLIQSEEIYPNDNIWGVRGCYTKNCDSESSLYYRIRPSVFHHLWSLGHNGSIFLPDIIGSSVPTGLTQCEVVSYGVRTRVLMTFHVYPNILKITCGGEGEPEE